MNPVDAFLAECEAEDKKKAAAKNTNGKPAPLIAKASNGRLDAKEFMAKHGLQVRAEKPKEGYVLYELAECPFDPTHNHGEASVTQSEDGALGFKCHHDSCGGKKWQDLRELFEPGFQERAAEAAAKRANVTPITAKKTEPEPEPRDRHRAC